MVVCRLFKQKVSQSRSSVKISDQVDRNSPKLIEAVFWSSLLDNVFKENLKKDPELRYWHDSLVTFFGQNEQTKIANFQLLAPKYHHTYTCFKMYVGTRNRTN